MGQGAIDYIGVKGGLDINGLIRDYYVYAGEKVSAGDFVEFINGVASRDAIGTSESVKLNTITYPSAIRTLLLSENRVFVAYGKSSVAGNGGVKSISAIICDVSGNTVIPHTDTVILSLSSGNAIRDLCISQLSNGNIFIAHGGTPNSKLYAVVCSISGTTITAGIDTLISSEEGSANNLSCVTLENDTIFVSHAVYNGYNVCCVVCTISGKTITPGTNTQVTTTANNASNTITQTIYLEQGKLCITYPHKLNNVNNTLCAMVCGVSGTTVTAGTEYQLSSLGYSGYRHSTTLLSKNKLFSVHGLTTAGNTSYLYGVVFEISNTTISHGTDTQLSSTPNSGLAMTISLKNNKAFIAYNGNLTTISLLGMMVEINLLTITANKETLLGTGTYNADAISAISVENENIFIANQYYDGTNYLFQTQVFSIDNINKVPTNEITKTIYETQVRKATTSDIYGVAKSSGVGAYKVVEYTIPDGESVSKGENREYAVETLVQEDLFPKTWTREDASYKIYSSGDFTLTANSIYQTGSAVDKLCNGSLSDYWRANTGSLIDIAIMELPVATKITKMKICIMTADAFKQATIWGSHDNSTWTNLYIETTVTNDTLTEMVLNNTDYYKYYRLRVEKKKDEIVGVREWQVSEYVKFIPYTATALESGTAGDTIQIAVLVSDEESTGHNDKIGVHIPDVPKLVDFINSVVPTVWIDGDDYMTATATNDYGEWNIEATTIYIDEGVVGNPPNRAFDDKDSSAYMTGNWGDITDKVYLYLNCPEGVSLKPSAITVKHGNCGNVSYNLSKVQAYDGSEWVELATLTSSASTQKTDTFNLSKKEYYTAFRIEITPGVQGNRSLVYDFKITSGTLKIKNWR